MKQSLDLFAIGNCSVAALVGAHGGVEWFCYPQFDGDPVLSRLINGPPEAGRPGYFDIKLGGLVESRCSYLGDSAVAVTVQKNAAGDEIEIIDFCPAPLTSRNDSTELPRAILRLVRPLKGKPIITAALRPTRDYGASAPEGKVIGHGSAAAGDYTAIAYGAGLFLRSNAPPEAVLAQKPAPVGLGLFFCFGEDLGALDYKTCLRWLDETLAYWKDWTGKLDIPKAYAAPVTRAAIALKICTHLPTGGMVAALTSSIPEFDNCKYRHWDYRYSWARDNYFTVNALTKLGDTQALTVYARWLQKILHFCRSNDTYPAAFRIAGTHDAEEHINETLSGYRGQGTVRVGNEAYKQQQNDFFASVILSLKPYFTDKRFDHRECPVPLAWLEELAAVAVKRYDRADAGLWELRTAERIYTYSAVNCWAACAAMAEIFAAERDAAKAAQWRAQAEKIKSDIIKRGWNEKLGSFTNAFQSDDADASLFLLSELGFLSGDDPLFAKTVAFLEERLREGAYVFRYDHADDFGPGCVNAFVPCTLWLAEALAAIPGRRAEAEQVFGQLLALRNVAGLLSEHIDPKTGELWANYPQTFSQAGIVTVAAKLS
jgi:hypothetical protein